MSLRPSALICSVIYLVGIIPISEFVKTAAKIRKNSYLCKDCMNLKRHRSSDKTIDHLQKTKDALLSSENNLRLANNKEVDGNVLVKIGKLCGKDFLTITPGVRFADGDIGDQVRVMTPAEAKKIGSDYIVVGRPITQADDPAEVLLRFWVLKEAAAKCSGEGLRGYPNRTEFSLEDPRVQERNGCFALTFHLVLVK